MFLEILLAILLGVTSGVFTGLIPGIHVNLICALLLSISPLLTSFFPLLSLAIFIITMATTHSFLDALPSVFLGAPESSTALGVLPGHRYLLKGWGLMAVKLTVIGSLGSIILSALLFALLVPLVSVGYPFIKGGIGYILLVIASFMILRDNKIGWSLFIFLLSGLLGYLVLHIPNIENPLFPLLSGLFGVATLLVSLNESNKIPKQDFLAYTDLHLNKTLQAIGSSTFSGFITAVLPGIGAATAAIISMQLTRKIGDHGFMILMGGISTSNFILSLVTLWSLDKARNGALVAVSSLMDTIAFSHILIFLFCSLIASGIACFAALKIGVFFSSFITKFSYKRIVLSIIFFILILTPFLSGLIGFLILISATGVGLLPAIKKTSRTQAMGCLLVPVMIFFLF